MKKFLGMYTRMTNCCFIFSLQAGVVIIGVLGTVWTASSMLMNLFRPYDSTFSILTLVQFVFAYLVLILICGGHVFLVLAGSWAHSNLMLIGFLYNSGVLLLWVTLSALSYLNNPQVTQIICIEGRCPDVLWLLDTYWRDTGEKCSAGTGDPNMHLVTREIFSIAPVLGYVSHWPDYIEQPGTGAPCFNNIPDTEHYVNYFDSGPNSSCPRADWLSWEPKVIKQRHDWHEYYKINTLVPKKPGAKPVFIYPYPPKKRSIIEEDYFNDVDDDDSAVKRTILNKTALFHGLLQQGCDLNDPEFMVASYAISMFFACFFLYGRAVEFNYYHELIMPLTLEAGRFRPSGVIIA